MSAIGEGDLSGWCLGVQPIWVPSIRSTAPKGTKQNDSDAQIIENCFYFVGPGAVANPEEEGEAWVHASPLGTG